MKKKKHKVIDNRFKQVYCTDCLSWTGLYDSLINNNPISRQCTTCYPYNPEDSIERIKRKNYKSNLFKK